MKSAVSAHLEALWEAPLHRGDEHRLQLRGSALIVGCDSAPRPHVELHKWVHCKVSTMVQEQPAETQCGFASSRSRSCALLQLVVQGRNHSRMYKDAAGR